MTSFSPFAIVVSDIIHKYTALGFKATNPTNPSNITSPIHPNNTNINHPPVANVGPPQSVKENTTVTLAGVANDPDSNDKVTYSWTQIEGPAVTLTGANTAFPTFTAPSNIPPGTELKFALTVKDDKGSSSNPAIAIITLMHINHPPIGKCVEQIIQLILDISLP